MQSFREFKDPALKPIFESYEVEHLSEAEVKEAERVYKELSEHIKKHGFEGIDEGLLGTIVGGLAGFVIGPAVGKIIANALGVERGILYDMFTSRLVSAALGASIAKNLS
jgi:hypothetical protein